MAERDPVPSDRVLPAGKLTTFEEMDGWHGEDSPDCPRMGIEPTIWGLRCQRCGWMLWVPVSE
jgi:hypothetical protein